MAMLYRSPIGAFSLLAALVVALVDAQAWDDGKYPRFEGAMGSRRGRPRGGPLRSDQASGPVTRSPADRRISGYLRGESRGSSPWRAGHRSDLSVPVAAHHARVFADGNRPDA